MCTLCIATLFEITGTTKGVFTHSQSSCHIAKVVLAFSHDGRQIPIASDAPPRHTSRGFLHWRLSDDGPGASRIVPDGRHPKPFTQRKTPLHSITSSTRVSNVASMTSTWNHKS